MLMYGELVIRQDYGSSKFVYWSRHKSQLKNDHSLNWSFKKEGSLDMYVEEIDQNCFIVPLKSNSSLQEVNWQVKEKKNHHYFHTHHYKIRTNFLSKIKLIKLKRKWYSSTKHLLFRESKDARAFSLYVNTLSKSQSNNISGIL